MFVRRSTYDKAEKRAFDAELALKVQRQETRELEMRLLVARSEGARWRDLAVQNIRQGKAAADPFTPEDFKRLLMLCHPDKHGGKTMAQEMTSKLLSMKSQLQKRG